MDRLSFWILVLAAAFVAGCASDVNKTTAEPEAQVAQVRDPDPWIERYFLLGREIYEKACASCHDEGADGTPAIGDRDAWSGRSPLWSAVLLQHAKDGHLDMPAKGGHAELSDRQVEAAGEYMLSVTFPELPRG